MEITFILVEPAVPENIGSAARALKTMGFSNLTLVNPCDHLSDPARWLAHGSHEILENAKVCTSLKEAIVNFDFIIGTSAKKRSVKFNYSTLNELPEIIASKNKSVQQIAVVFGREESGLTNRELQQCDLVTTVPLKTTYPSLNLAQAVMLYAYELSKKSVTARMIPELNQQSFRTLKEKTRSVLLDIGFKENSNIFPRFMERLNFLSEDDIHLLHSFCNKFRQNQK